MEPDDNSTPGERASTTFGVVREAGRQAIHDDVLGMSAELAFRFFLALFPFFVFLSALGGFIANELRIENPAEQAVELIGDALPEEGTQFVEDQLRNILDEQSRGELIGGALLALFIATGGTNAIIKALNRAYGVRESRPFPKRYLLALLITLTAGAGAVLAFTLFIPLRVIAPQVAELLQIDGMLPPLFNAFAVVGSIFLVFVAVSLLFRIGPSIRLPGRAVFPGAALFAVGWLVATYLFGTWASEFADYASSYGMLANVAVIMVWFYVLALVLLISAEVNVAIHKATDPEDLERRRNEAAERHERMLERATDAARRVIERPDEEPESETAAT